MLCVLYHSARLHARLNEPLRRAFASCLTKHPLFFVSYCQNPVPCRETPLQYPDHGLCGRHPLTATPSFARRILRASALDLVSLSSRSSSQGSRIGVFSIRPLKESYVPFAVNNVQLYNGRMTDVPPERYHDAHPFILHVWRTSGHRRCTWQSYQSETTERRRNGVRVVRRLIADSIRLLMNCPSTNSLCGVRDPRSIGRKHLRCPPGPRILAFVRLSLHPLDSFAIPRLLHLHTRAVLHLQIELNSNHDFSVNWNLFD